MAVNNHLILSLNPYIFMYICMCSCLITLAGVAFKILHRSDDNVINRHIYLVSDLKEKTFNISLLTKYLL